MLSERERLDKAVESVVGMIFFDEDGRVTGSNEVFRRVSGYTREEIESGTLNWRTLTPPECVEETERQFRRLQSSGHIGPYEKEYLLKDGTRRWMLFTGRKLGDETVAVMGDETVAVICVDITRRKRAELAVQKSEKRRKQLIADLAHGLNNPLQIATSALHLLRAESAPRPSIDALQEGLNRMRSLSRKLLSATDDVDTHARPEAHAVVPAAEIGKDRENACA